MPPQQPSLADFHANDGGGMNIYGQAIRELPSAAAGLAAEAWQNPGQAVGHAAKVVVESAVMGTAIGYIVPARGPASIIVGVALTAPAVYHAGHRLVDAHEQAKNPLADHQAIAHALARDTITGTTDLGLSFAGGYAGAEFGYALAGSKGTMGRLSQSMQRGIMRAENKGLALVRGMIEGRPVGSGPTAGALPKIDIYNGVPKTGSAAHDVVNGPKPEIVPIPKATETAITSRVRPSVESWPLIGQRMGILNRRVEQAFDGSSEGFMFVQGPLHGHSKYSDGMGTPKEIYARAKEQGMDFAAITDHNHPAARGGVKPDDARAKDQADTPTVAESPILYAQTFADAAAATENGTFVGLVGVELGTIGKVGGGHKHDDFVGGLSEIARPTPPKPTAPGETPRINLDLNPGKTPGKPDGVLPNIDQPVGPVGRGPDGTTPQAGEAPNMARKPNETGSMAGAELSAEAAAAHAKHLGGVNHINVFEVPTFLESVRQPKTLLDTTIEAVTGRPRRATVKEPDVVKINDGDFRALADHLDGLKDSTGGTPVIQLNHPRFRADENPNTPRADRGRDYGQKAFRSHKEWLERFADPYVRQIEVIKGGALNPDPVDVVPPGAVDATSFAGYLDKGVHASPTFGRDFHYGDPGGTPGTTSILVRSHDKAGIMDGLRERRTIATTNGEKLQASMWANDKHPMGSILDQAAVSELALTARVGGEVHPDAQYTIKLWGDTKLGDKKLAEVVQETKMTGQELLDAQSKVSFDALEHRLGNKSAYWMEIQRVDPVTGHNDRMFTAPIWVEPLTGDKHSFYMRFLTGNSANFLDGMIRGK